jgi:hypothetical protein
MDKPYIWFMKTTLNVRDDLYRRAKAQAALQGKSLGRFLEDAIERSLNQNKSDSISCAAWASALPRLSNQAATDLENALAAPDFRTIDKGMWV